MVGHGAELSAGHDERGEFAGGGLVERHVGHDGIAEQAIGGLIAVDTDHADGDARLAQPQHRVPELQLLVSVEDEDADRACHDAPLVLQPYS
jgi:hypothetical protein